MAAIHGPDGWAFHITAEEFSLACGSTPKWLLLTGAGFSANWGTPVAEGMWAEIISDGRLANAPNVRRELLTLDGFNFENVLSKAHDGAFDPAEAAILWNIVYTAYSRIEEILHMNGAGQPASDLDALFAQFQPRSREETGFVFTLNQDLLLERQFNVGHGNPDFIRPGVKEKQLEGEFTAADGERMPRSYVTPTPVGTLSIEFDLSYLNLRGKTNYLKLHGSVDWVSRAEHHAVIVGGDKPQAIKNYLLLTAYFELFRRALFQGDRRLMIIGYGFADHHVNATIAEAIRDHGLRLHIWDTKSPKQLYNQLEGQYDEIWEGIVGYTQKPLTGYININQADRARPNDSYWFFQTVFNRPPDELRQNALPAFKHYPGLHWSE